MARLGDLGREERWAILGTSLVLLYSVYRRSVDLDPGSLWLDDAWVAVLSRAPDLGAMLANGSTSPPIFNALVALSIAAVPDLEIAAQLVPFAGGLLAIAATSWAALLLTRSAVCAVFAAAVYACDPFAIEFAARVKQYSTDALVSVLLLATFHLLLERYSPRRLWTFAALASIGLFLSTLSVFVAGVLVPTALATLYLRRDREPVPIASLAAAGTMTTAAALFLYLGFLRGIDSAVTTEYWRDSYLPTESAGALFAGVANVVALWLDRLLHGFPEGVLPGVVAIGLVLLALGALHLWLAGFRAHLVAAIGIPLLVFAASAAQRLPLGSGRVELFLMPLLACGLACGVALALRLPNERLRTGALALAIVFAAIQLPSARLALYPAQHVAPLVDVLNEELKPGDRLVTNLHGSFALSLYGPWPIELVRDDRLMTQFHPEPILEGFSVAEDTDLGPIERLRPSRVFVFGSHYPANYPPQMIEGLAGLGYQVSWISEEPGCFLLLLERAPS